MEQAIQIVAGEWPTYGYYRITTAQFNKQRWAVNRKRIYRLLSAMAISIVKKAHKRRNTKSHHPFRVNPTS